MGELDEKETAPANTANTATTTPTAEVIAIDEPKETETLLAPAASAAAADTKSVDEATPAAAAAAPAVVESPKSTTSTTATIEKVPTDAAVAEIQAADAAAADDKEKEKLLPEAEAAAIVATGEKPAAAAAAAAVTPEGREVKPKKIPIGGIKMPGFFTKSKPKTAADADGADGELLPAEKNADAVDVEAGQPNEETAAATSAGEEAGKPARSGFLAALRNIRNPFAKKPAAEPVQTEEDGELKEVTIAIDDGTTPADKPADESVAAAPPTKKGLLNAIRLPIVNIIPKKLRPVNGGNAAATAAATDADATAASVADGEDVELGQSGPHNKAGLASMETLDDPLKDTEAANGKDVTDKSATIKADDMETIKLTAAEGGAGDEKDPTANGSKADEAAGGAGGAKPTLADTLRAYRCSIDDMAIAGGLLIFVVLVGIICVFTFTGHGEVKSAPVRDGRFVLAYTTCGPAEGVLEDSAFAFRGLPYAKAERFRPARPLEHLTDCWNNTLDAHRSGPVCLQRAANGSLVGAEHCLNVDVVTPHVRYDNPLPVVVLFGADTYWGGAPGVLRPSARFARKNDVIFVRPNIRMGVLGFLAHPALAEGVHPPTSGNYALTDMLAALQWVQLNIAHFGGNPAQVTVVGHRVGATLVAALVTSARANALYSRAWVSSGAGLFPGRSLAETQAQNAAEMAAAGVCGDAKCLLELPADELLAQPWPAAWTRSQTDLPQRDELASKRHEWLVLDGDILRQNPVERMDREPAAVPRLVIGTARHAAHTPELLGASATTNWTAEAVRAYVEQSRVGELNLTEQALERYGANYTGLVAMVSDIRTVCPLLTTARLQPSVPFYVVTQADVRGLAANSTEPSLARIDADVLAILGRYEPHTPEQRRYVSAVQQLFYHYVSHGEMPLYDSRQRVLDVGQDVLSRADYANCDFWINADVVMRYARTF